MQAFYDAALTLGAESLHAPRLWPEYHPGYFGAFVRDPDGNNVEAVFHGARRSNQAPSLVVLAAIDPTECHSGGVTDTEAMSTGRGGVVDPQPMYKMLRESSPVSAPDPMALSY